VHNQTQPKEINKSVQENESKKVGMAGNRAVAGDYYCLTSLNAGLSTYQTEKKRRKLVS